MIKRWGYALIVTLAMALPLGGASRFATNSDNYNASDDCAVGTAWRNWTVVRGSFCIDTNQVEMNPGGLQIIDKYWAEAVDDFTDDQFSEVTLVDIGTAANAGGGPTCRHSGTSPNETFYLAFAATDTSTLYKVTAGLGFTDLSGSLPTFADGDEIKIECTGSSPTTIKVYKNGVQVGVTVNDSSSPYTTGQPGVMMYSATAAGVTMDDWNGGDFTAGTPAIPPFWNPIIYRIGFGQRANPSDNEVADPEPPAGWCEDCELLTAADITYLGVFKLPSGSGGDPDFGSYGARSMTGRIVGGDTRLLINQSGSGGTFGKWAPVEIIDPESYSQTLGGAVEATIHCNWGWDFQGAVKYEGWHDKVGKSFDTSTGEAFDITPSFLVPWNFAWQGNLLHLTYGRSYGNYVADWNHVAISLDACNQNGSVATSTTAYGPWRTYNGLYRDGTKVLGPSRHADLTIMPDGSMGSGSGPLNYQYNYGSLGPSLVGGAAWPTSSTPVGFGTDLGGGQRSTDLVNDQTYLWHASMVGFVTNGVATGPITFQRRPGTYFFEDVGCPPQYGAQGAYLDPDQNGGQGSWNEADGVGHFELINGTNKWGYISFQAFAGNKDFDGTTSCTTGRAHLWYKTTVCMLYHRNFVEAEENVIITGENNNLSFSATTFTDMHRVRYINAGASQSLSVGVSGKDITVTLATDGSSVITSTAAQVKAAVEADGTASKLVTIVHGFEENFGGYTSDGSGLVTATADYFQLAGGPNLCPLHDCDTDIIVTGPVTTRVEAAWGMYDPSDLISVNNAILDPYEPEPNWIYPTSDIDSDIVYQTDLSLPFAYSSADSWYDTVNHKMYVINNNADPVTGLPVIAVYLIDDSASPQQIFNRTFGNGGTLAFLGLTAGWIVRRKLKQIG